MYLSDRDIKWAIDKGQLIIEPPSIVSPTSIDLHLDRVEEAQIWNLKALHQSHNVSGIPEPVVYLRSFNWVGTRGTLLNGVKTAITPSGFIP